MSPTYPPSTSPVQPNAVAEMAQQARMSVPTFMCRFTDQADFVQWLVIARTVAVHELLETNCQRFPKFDPLQVS